MTHHHAHTDTGAHPHPEHASDVAFDAPFWDARYSSQDALWSGHPNARLVEEAAALRPGTAIDVGCGEGADAIWLAGRGWRVTAVDVSVVAIERARTHADAAGVGDRITFQQVDLITDDVPGAPYDLVTSQYFHLPTATRDPLFARLAAAVAPGGTLLIVGHHPGDLGVVPRPLQPDLFFTAEELAAALDASQWTLDTVAAAARTTPGPDGVDVTIHDAVLRATRRS
jgi:SAM-dependent methyltransferase